jgi:hypothetical protein
MLRQIAAAIHALSAERTDRLTMSTSVREIAKTEAEKIGIAEFARRLRTDPSNLRKAINGAREFGLELERPLRRYGGGDGKQASEPCPRHDPFAARAEQPPTSGAARASRQFTFRWPNAIRSLAARVSAFLAPPDD